MQSGKNARAMNVNKNQKPNPKGKGKGTPPKNNRGPKPQRSGGSRGNGNKQFSAAAAYSTGNSGKAPNVAMSKDSCRVIHRELLGNVSGTASAAFTVASTFALNPGDAQTFPWLSNMAQNWETYRFNSLRVCYYTRTGSNTAGSVMIVPDYDAADGSPVTEQTAASFEDIQEDAPWKDITCRLRSNAMNSSGPKKFCRFGSLSANQDIKTYDSGNIFICTVDSAGAAPWGKLWIEYDVTLFTPQLPSAGSNFSSINAINGVGALTNTNIFGTGAVITGNGGATAAGNVLTLSNLLIGQEYLLSLNLAGTVISALGAPTLVGLTQKSLLFFNFPVAATSANETITYTATAVSGSITFTATATTITASNTVFSLIPTSSF